MERKEKEWKGIEKCPIPLFSWEAQTRGVQQSRQADQSAQPNPIQPKICGFMNLCGLGWVELKFLKLFLIVWVMGSIIGKPIDPNLTDYKT